MTDHDDQKAKVTRTDISEKKALAELNEYYEKILRDEPEPSSTTPVEIERITQIKNLIHKEKLFVQKNGNEHVETSSIHIDSAAFGVGTHLHAKSKLQQTYLTNDASGSGVVAKGDDVYISTTNGGDHIIHNAELAKSIHNAVRDAMKGNFTHDEAAALKRAQETLTNGDANATHTDVQAQALKDFRAADMVAKKGL